MQSNIFTVSAAYLFKYFYQISFWTKRLQKKCFSMEAARDYFLFQPASG